MSPTCRVAEEILRPEAASVLKPSPRVLVVDDDTRFALRMKLAFEENGFSAEAVFDAQSALYLAASGPLDLIVLDVKMPGMDGIECLRALRTRRCFRHTPVVLITGDPSARVEILSLVYEQCYAIRKPCTYEDVIGVAKGLLSGKDELQGAHGALPAFSDGVSSGENAP